MLILTGWEQHLWKLRQLAENCKRSMCWVLFYWRKPYLWNVSGNVVTSDYSICLFNNWPSRTADLSLLDYFARDHIEELFLINSTNSVGIFSFQDFTAGWNIFSDSCSICYKNTDVYLKNVWIKNIFYLIQPLFRSGIR